MQEIQTDMSLPLEEWEKEYRKKQKAGHSLPFNRKVKKWYDALIVFLRKWRILSYQSENKTEISEIERNKFKKTFYGMVVFFTVIALIFLVVLIGYAAMLKMILDFLTNFIKAIF